MSYALLAKKIMLKNSRIITREELKGYAKALRISYESAIGYLISNGYLVRILRGIFYAPSMDEKRLKKTEISYFTAVKEAMKAKEIGNWYFGLETALKLNNLTHEYFAEDAIISDAIHRNRPFSILGHSTRFIKLKAGLFGFGIVVKEGIPYSDPEKTLLDMMYLARYNNLPESAIRAKVAGYFESCNPKIIERYAHHYPKSVERMVNDIKKAN